METATPVSISNHQTKSELEKFKLFYEYVVPEKETRVQTQSKQSRPIRRRNNDK